MFSFWIGNSTWSLNLISFWIGNFTWSLNWIRFHCKHPCLWRPLSLRHVNSVGSFCGTTQLMPCQDSWHFCGYIAISILLTIVKWIDWSRKPFNIYTDQYITRKKGKSQKTNYTEFVLWTLSFPALVTVLLFNISSSQTFCHYLNHPF